MFLARWQELGNSHMRQANDSLGDEKFNMTSAIRASTDAYVRLQCSDYGGASRLSELAWAVIQDGWMAIDVTLLCVPILVASLAGQNWLAAAEIRERKPLKRALRRTFIFYRMLPNQQPRIDRVRGRTFWKLGKERKAIRHLEKAVGVAKAKGMKYQQAKSLLDLAAVKEEHRDENHTEAIRLLKEMESVIPRAESWLFGDQYDDSIIAPEFDLGAWE